MRGRLTEACGRSKISYLYNGRESGITFRVPRRATDPPPPDPQQIIDDQAPEIERLREDLRRSEAERQRLRRENEKLKDELEAARRAVYRQAAPFSRDTPKTAPRRPGRKRGAAYGRRAHRPSAARRRDLRRAAAGRSVRAVRPPCDGPRVVTQYQEELPVQRPVGAALSRSRSASARQCRRRVQGRHPLQTSDALGAAAVQLGPQAVALRRCCSINGSACPTARSRALLRDRFGLTVTRGGLVHAVHRAARQAQPTYDVAVRDGARESRRDRRMKRVGASTPTCSGCGRLSRPRRPSMRFNRAAASRKRPRVIGADYPGVLAARRLAVVPAIYARRASDVSRASAPPLSRAAARLSEQPFVTGGESDPAGGARDARRAIAPARSRRTASPSRAATTSSGSAGCSQRTPSRRLARPPVSSSTSSSNSTPSSAFSSTRRSTRPTGAPNRPCGPPSSPARCAAAAIAPPAARRRQQVLASVLRTADQRGLDATDLLVALLTAPTPVVPVASAPFPRYTDPLTLW